MITNLLLVFLATCSLMDYMHAEIVYAAISGLPMNLTPPPAGEIRQNLRPQRSLYGGWHGPPVHSQSIGLGHITKQELITLLEAAKEVAGPSPEPEPETQPEPEPEAEPEAGPEPAPAPESAGPPAGVPLTVSLPAFVPIQLSAMYTAPPPAAAPAAPAAGEEESEEEDEEEAEDEDEEEEVEEELEPAPAPIIKPYHPVYHPWSSRGLYGGGRVVQNQPRYVKKGRSRAKSKSRAKTRKSKSKRSKSKSKSRSKKRTNNLRYAASQQSIQALPPPPFLSRAPGPLKLVPSNQLLSNWN